MLDSEFHSSLGANFTKLLYIIVFDLISHQTIIKYFIQIIKCMLPILTILQNIFQKHCMSIRLMSNVNFFVTSLKCQVGKAMDCSVLSVEKNRLVSAIMRFCQMLLELPALVLLQRVTSQVDLHLLYYRYFVVFVFLYCVAQLNSLSIVQSHILLSILFCIHVAVVIRCSSQ